MVIEVNKTTTDTIDTGNTIFWLLKQLGKAQLYDCVGQYIIKVDIRPYDKNVK